MSDATQGETGRVLQISTVPVMWCLWLVGAYSLSALYGWLPRTYLLVTGWIGLGLGFLLVALWLIGWAQGWAIRPFLFHRVDIERSAHSGGSRPSS